MSLEVNMDRKTEMCYSKYGSMGSNKGIAWELARMQNLGPLHLLNQNLCPQGIQGHFHSLEGQSLDTSES